MRTSVCVLNDTFDVGGRCVCVWGGGVYVYSYSGPKVQSFLFSAPLFSQTNGAEKRTNGAENRTNGAEKRTNGAEKRTNGAEKRTNGAEKRTNGAEKRKCTLGPSYIAPFWIVVVWMWFESGKEGVVDHSTSGNWISREILTFV